MNQDNNIGDNQSDASDQNRLKKFNANPAALSFGWQKPSCVFTEWFWSTLKRNQKQISTKYDSQPHPILINLIPDWYVWLVIKKMSYVLTVYSSKKKKPLCSFPFKHPKSFKSIGSEEAGQTFHWSEPIFAHLNHHDAIINAQLPWEPLLCFVVLFPAKTNSTDTHEYPGLFSFFLSFFVKRCCEFVEKYNANSFLFFKTIETHFGLGF